MATPIAVQAANGKTSTKPAEIEIRLNVDELQIGDLLTLSEEKERSMKNFVQILNRVVIGGAGHLPVTTLRAITEEMRLGIGGLIEAVSAADAPQLDIEINLDNLTLDDLVVMEDASNRSIAAVVEMLERVVAAEIDVKALPIKYIGAISREMRLQMEGLTNPKN